MEAINEAAPLSLSEQILDDKQLQPLVIAGVDVALPRLAVDGVRDIHEQIEDLLGML
jgi:hypothetical protein